MKERRCVIGGLLTLFGFVALLASYVLPSTSVEAAGLTSVYLYLGNLDGISENNELFIGTILCIAVAALLLFCTIVAVLSLSKGQGSRSVFFTRVTAFLALACSIVAAVMFAKASSWLVGAGAILPVLCAFVVFVGSLVLPSDKAN